MAIKMFNVLVGVVFFIATMIVLFNASEEINTQYGVTVSPEYRNDVGSDDLNSQLGVSKRTSTSCQICEDGGSGTAVAASSDISGGSSFKAAFNMFGVVNVFQKIVIGDPAAA